MKIAYILSTCQKSGPFIVAQDIINNISDQVEQIDVYYVKESADKLHYNAVCKKVKLFEKTDLSGYDIVHAHGFLGDVYLYLNRSSVKGKTLTTLHQKIAPDYTMNYNRLIGTVLEKLWCKMVNKFDAVVSLTNEMADYYQFILKREIKFIYNGITPVCSSAEVPEDTDLRVLKNKYVILGISAGLIYRKGIDQVIRALALPGAENMALLILGEGKMKEELIILAEKLKVKDRCFFLGFRKNVIDYFKYFDVYIMSSRSEGFGLCVLEAASQKIPVVSNDLPVFNELFDPADMVKFKLDDLDSFLSAVNKALTQKTQLGNNIYNRYQLNYTAKSMAINYLGLYHKLFKQM